MRHTFWLKMLLTIGCIYLSIQLTLLNYSVDKSIHVQYEALGKLKNDPALDSSVNRKRYALRTKEINQQINQLQEKRYADWLLYIGILLSPVSGWLIRYTFYPLLKKRSK
jgi:hypothetical protein